ARALSDMRPVLRALCGFPRPVEAGLGRIARENPRMFATPVRLVLRAWFGDDARRIIREYLPPASRQYGSARFDGKPELLDRVGMPFAPKVDQDLRQPPPQDPGPVHTRTTSGASVTSWLWSPGRRFYGSSATGEAIGRRCPWRCSRPSYAYLGPVQSAFVKYIGGCFWS